MSATRTAILFASILLSFIPTSHLSFSQSPSFPISEWSKKLGAKNAPLVSGINDILTALKDKDSAEGARVFNELERKENLSDKYFVARFAMAKCWWLRGHLRGATTELIKDLTNRALIAAYETNNDSLVSFVSWQSGSLMYYSGQIELASMYCINAAEVDEKIGRRTTDAQYWTLENVLYATRENEKCIYYTKQAIEHETNTAYATRHDVMGHCNTIGLCWKRIGNYDSAFSYFNAALRMSVNLGDKIWESIISGNRGQVFFAQQKYGLAKPLLESDYRFSKAYGEVGSAANSLQWVARINLAAGKKDSALMQVREALGLVRKDPNPGYLQNVYYATAEVYRAFDNRDSVYKYDALYNQLHDSIEKAVAESRLEISRIRLDNLQSALTIKNLNEVKQAEKLKRNFSIAAIVLVSIIALLYVNRLRLKLRYKDQLAIEQKKNADAEIAAARQQLDLFTQNLVEKTGLIEQLQHQVENRVVMEQQQQLISNISDITILTEDDWEKFKSLFEKIYPGFFTNLKEKVSDITLAEQRMAALTRLHLTTKQIGSILGISPNSVNKTKQRLRQRLNVDAETNIEDILAKF